MKTKTYSHAAHRAELHHTGKAPNCRPLLKIFRANEEKPLIEVELGDFCGCALWFYEGYLVNDLGLERGSKNFQRLLKRGRRGLGYSYP